MIYPSLYRCRAAIEPYVNRVRPIGGICKRNVGKKLPRFQVFALDTRRKPFPSFAKCVANSMDDRCDGRQQPRRREIFAHDDLPVSPSRVEIWKRRVPRTEGSEERNVTSRRATGQEKNPQNVIARMRNVVKRLSLDAQIPRQEF